MSRSTVVPPASPVAAFALAAALAAAPAAAQPPPFGDYGDAPEGALAYPSTGTLGSFPTCYLFGGPSGFVVHGDNTPCWLGMSVDSEGEGAAGGCPVFGYEADECYGPTDFDAGLSGPFDTYTIAAGVEVPCNPNGAGVAIGRACHALSFSPAFDLFVTNNAGTDLVLNVAFDWDGDGSWGGIAACPNVPGGAPEHALVNFPIPNGYVGPVSALAPPSITIGPRAGFVWARFTLSEQPGVIALPWDGSGDFDLGETEDYLLRIDPDTTGGGGQNGEYGDAPEGQVAYPDGTVGRFPTCIDPTGPAGFVFHAPGTRVYFGPGLDFETDGNAGLCPPAPFDADECARAGGDAGLLLPEPFTLDAGFALRSCPGSTGHAMGIACGTAQWGSQLDIEVTNGSASDVLLQVLADWNRDGGWDGTVMTCVGGVTASEQVLRDFVIPSGFSGPLSLLNPPPFDVPADPGLCWFRFSLTGPGLPADWDGAGNFAGGETEDYLLFVGYDPIGAGEPHEAPGGALALAALSANPFRATAHVGLTLAREQAVTVRVVDLAGRVVATLAEGRRAAGRHLLAWSGDDDAGRRAPAGLYFVEARAGDEIARLKLTRLR